MFCSTMGVPPSHRFALRHRNDRNHIVNGPETSNSELRTLDYSTVTLFARFLGWSTLQPLITAMW